MVDYWNKEYTDLCEGIIFKFKQISPVALINLITKDIDIKKMSVIESEAFINKCLQNVVWTKNGGEYMPLLNDDGSGRLQELETQPYIALDLFYKFRADVLTPVFIESKTYQNFTQELNKTKTTNK